MNSSGRPSLPIAALNAQRRLAVRLRLEGLRLKDVAARTRLSLPTIIAACKAYATAGWPGVDVRARGRSLGDGRALSAEQERAVVTVLVDTAAVGVKVHISLLTTESVAARIAAAAGTELSPRAIAHYLGRWNLRFPRPARAAGTRGSWQRTRYPGIVRAARAAGAEILWIGDRDWRPFAGTPRDLRILYAVSNRGRARWIAYRGALRAESVTGFFAALAADSGRPLTLLLDGLRLDRVSEVQAWLAAQAPRISLIEVPSPAAPARHPDPSPPLAPPPAPPSTSGTATMATTLTHLQRLEAESIHVLREVVAEADNPVMLYSIGKDSAVMLHLALKAFYPAKPPFPLLHIDTLWKFREMYEFRDRTARELGLDLIVHVNPEGRAQGINPFTHGSQIHTDIMKTQALRQALDKYGFDVAFGGARRDEEKSRAKERIFSFRSAAHRWDPKGQRPELWHLYNARKHKGESIRAFPLSNWTELDVWQYIERERIPLVPLYFAKPRPVVERDGALIMVDDDRMPLKPGEVPTMRTIRFRTLGCYPLTGAIESTADGLSAIIQEMLLTKTSERQGRVIDHDQAASMEKKKQEGYF